MYRSDVPLTYQASGFVGNSDIIQYTYNILALRKISCSLKAKQ